jgi:hypothetical protein
MACGRTHRTTESIPCYCRVIVNEIKDALQKFQIQNLEALLALADLEEAGLARELLSYDTPAERRIAALNRQYEIPIEREIILQHLADFGPPLRVSLD